MIDCKATFCDLRRLLKVLINKNNFQKDSLLAISWGTLFRFHLVLQLTLIKSLLVFQAIFFWNGPTFLNQINIKFANFAKDLQKPTRVRFTKSFKKFYKNFYNFCDVTIFTQPISAVWLKRLRENGDVTEIFAEFFGIFRESHSKLSKGKIIQKLNESFWC